MLKKKSKQLEEGEDEKDEEKEKGQNEENEDNKKEEKNENKEVKAENEINNVVQNNINKETPITPITTIEKKIKFPIVPYKISDDYHNQLLMTLKKENRLRPKVLLAPERDDITRDVKILDKEENEQKEREKEEDLYAEDKEREDKIFINKYKESALLGKTLIQDPMALFKYAEKVYIDQFYKLSDLFVICPLYFNYRISLQYKVSDTEYLSYYLFNTKEISPSCSHNCCSNQAREIDVNIFNFVLDSEARPLQKFIKLTKNCRCAVSCFCACCSRPTFIVETPVEMLGKIIEIRTICDPIIIITDINNDIIYRIRTNCSDWGYCCRDECCDGEKCSKAIFYIYGKDDELLKKPFGYINKHHRSGKKTKPDYDQIEIIYPPEISCQDKVLLMCSALAIEYLYFQNLTNSKRCNGKPRFLNSYSD